MFDLENKNNILNIDPWLKPYKNQIIDRFNSYQKVKKELTARKKTLYSFADAHLKFGFVNGVFNSKTGVFSYKKDGDLYYRERAPKAQDLFLTGDFNNWSESAHPLEKINDTDFQIKITKEMNIKDGDRIKVIVKHHNTLHYRLPVYIKKVIQEKDRYGNPDFIGIVKLDKKIKRQRKNLKITHPIIYETHIGMAQEECKVGTFKEFQENILPRIKALGYNTIQFMAIMEHPYYGSFGYHVSNFFAVSSRFGDSDDLKELIDECHRQKIMVIMDLVHSHAISNTVEGIREFDGTIEQFFHKDDRAFHKQWDSMCFDYKNKEVLHMLLSNIRYWLEEFKFDGFRFDGVTSMLYKDHGLNTHFNNYSQYFSQNTDIDAVNYLMLANELIHDMKTGHISIAEDMSGMPGLCLPIKDGGLGFDYRLQMGTPDMWIKMVKESKDKFDLNKIYYELTSKRVREKTINYVESHDQALVGDKTLFFRLTGPEIYTHMSKFTDSWNIDNSIAKINMIKLITISTGTDGWLNFMGNEFGHPEWIDFPREGNNWSHYYARRQWHLVDDHNLKYEYLNNFDKNMIKFVQENFIFNNNDIQLLFVDNNRQILAFRNKKHIFIFNFSDTNSYEGFELPTYISSDFKVVFSTDKKEFGGFNRVDENIIYPSLPLASKNNDNGIKIYLPTHTGIVLKQLFDF